MAFLEKQIRYYYKRDCDRLQHARQRAGQLQPHAGTFILKQADPGLDNNLSGDDCDLLHYLCDDIQHNPSCYPAVVLPENAWHVSRPGHGDRVILNLELDAWEPLEVALRRRQRPVPEEPLLIWL